MNISSQPHPPQKKSKVCVSCCISHNFAWWYKPYGPWDHVPFGPLLMTQALPYTMIVKMMMRTFVLCVVANTPPQFVGSAMRGIALNVLTLALVDMKSCMLHLLGIVLQGNNVGCIIKWESHQCEEGLQGVTVVE